jgi:hypothetical protein
MSDHISGPRALADPIADITDVYAFPSVEQTQRLVLVMNTLPFAQPSDLFSDGLVSGFRLRPLTAAAANGDLARFVAAGDELGRHNRGSGGREQSGGGARYSGCEPAYDSQRRHRPDAGDRRRAPYR